MGQKSYHNYMTLRSRKVEVYRGSLSETLKLTEFRSPVLRDLACNDGG